MKRPLFLSVILLAAGCATPLPQHPPAGSPASIPVPRVSEGDTWIYAARDGYTGIARGTYRHRVVEASGERIVVEVTKDGAPFGVQQIYTRDWNWIEAPMITGRHYRYEPSYAAFAFPLAAGKSWKTEIKATDPATGQVNRVKIYGKVLGWERVKVPAGEFDALVVRRHVYDGAHDYFRSETYIDEYDWYAPAIASFVKHQDSSGYKDKTQNDPPDYGWVRGDWNVIELVRYQPGGR